MILPLHDETTSSSSSSSPSTGITSNHNKSIVARTAWLVIILIVPWNTVPVLATAMATEKTSTRRGSPNGKPTVSSRSGMIQGRILQLEGESNTDNNVFDHATTTLSSSNLLNLLPAGPYITPKTANEKVTIPDPPQAIAETPFHCPHLDYNLVDWKNLFPEVQNGSNVTLPPNTRVIVRESIPSVLAYVTIPPSSELLFDDIASEPEITMNLLGMDVQGNLTIGSETCRIVHSKIIITLHGERPYNAVEVVPDPIQKGISVTGQLSLHGQRFYQTWTRLARTVQPGDTFLLLQHFVNWEAGQEIVLVTTAMKDSREWHRNEVVHIKSIETTTILDGVGAVVFLEQPAQYQHVAEPGSYQGEVGLLSRNIIIQGHEHDSEPTDPDTLDCHFDGTVNLDSAATSSRSSSTTNFRGDTQRPCPNTDLTGYGGHIMIHRLGKGYVEGVELYRMGQTNVLGRYPMHFHLLGDDCRDCYFKDSAVHRSFYRCVSIHGTNATHISENVAYDVSGFCFYLEDGVEQENRIEYNLGAHIHQIGNVPAMGLSSQVTDIYRQSSQLTMPGDVTASAFYITNIHNYLIGNAASGGWAGFCFPNLPSPLGPHRDVNMRPSSVTGLTIDGNTAHSTGWWWDHAAAFYFGGSIYYNEGDGVLEYNAGRDLGNRRFTCLVNKCLDRNSGCDAYCRTWEQAWLTITNSKAFLVAGAGFGSWSGRLEVLGYECHDCGRALEALSDGFWLHDSLTVCRTSIPMALPIGSSSRFIRADGFQWYDTGQEHILSQATFRNCGYRSEEYNQYDTVGGCGDEDDVGCTPDSSVWSFVTHSDENVPEIMQATQAVKFENCGRRFRFRDFRKDRPSSVSGREQNWWDVDGSVTGFGESSVIASGLADAGMWWQVDSKVVYDEQGPLWFFTLSNGPERGLGHFRMIWDEQLDSQVGTTQCGNGENIPCDYVGSIKHLGEYYRNESGLPVTANADIVGPVGGFGWKLELDGGAPKSVRFEEIEVSPDTPMLLSIAYPPGTSFNITYRAGWCTDSEEYTCTADFRQVHYYKDVRKSQGNAYHVDANGVLTLRIIQTPKTFVGRPEFFLPQYSDKGKNGMGFALDRFERNGIRLPKNVDGAHLTLDADCPSNDGVYCSEGIPPSAYEEPDEVCPSGYYQTGYDTCTSSNDEMTKLFAHGTIKVETVKPCVDYNDDDAGEEEGNYSKYSGGSRFELALLCALWVGCCTIACL